MWPDSEPVPYLVSVKDPHDDISPYHDWGPVTFTVKQLAAQLGSRLPAGLKKLEVKSNRWGRAQTVIAVGKNGSKEISGWDMRILLGLRSTWFTIEVVGNEPATGRAALWFGGADSGGDEVTHHIRRPELGLETIRRAASSRARIQR